MKKVNTIFVWTPVSAAVALLTGLLVCNAAILGNPPFWDDILGLHAQALFLADHGFSRTALCDSGTFWEGGAMVYRWNILPWGYAVLYRLLPAEMVHGIGHVFNIGCLAVAATLMVLVLRHFRFSWWAALGWGAAALAEPLLAAQGAALGQEPPLVLAGMMVVAAAGFGRWQLALAAVVAVAAIKLMAVVPAAALLGYFLFRAWRSASRRREMLQDAAWAGVLTILTAWLLIHDSDGAAQTMTVHSLMAMVLGRMREHFSLYFPQLAVLLVMAGALTGWRVWRLIREGGTETEPDRFRLFLWLFQGGFWGAYFFYSVPLPRYAAFAVMTLILLLALLLPEVRTWRLGGGALLLAANLLLCGGAFFPKLPPPRRYSGEFLERSREFLRQIELDRRVTEALSQEATGTPVVAKWPYVQMLGEARFGYVRQPLPELYSAGIVPRYLPRVRKYTGKELDTRPETIYIFVCNTFEFFRDFGVPLAPRPGDRVVFAGDDREAPFLLYQREERTRP